MEDRLTPVLHLERCDASPDEYAARAADLAGHEGVERVTWWLPQVRGRTDVPMRMAEFGLLGVIEADASFEPPVPPDGGAGHHFRRTPRPGQGQLSGRPTLGLLVVMISPRDPGGAQDLRDWGDFVHLRHIAAAAPPGYTMITPYENAAGGEPRFLHFYEMDTDEPEAAYRGMTPLVEERLGPPGTPAFDDWAWHEQLWIESVGTYRLEGST